MLSATGRVTSTEFRANREAMRAALHEAVKRGRTKPVLQVMNASKPALWSTHVLNSLNFPKWMQQTRPAKNPREQLTPQDASAFPIQDEDNFSSLPQEGKPLTLQATMHTAQCCIFISVAWYCWPTVLLMDDTVVYHRLL